MGKKYIYNNVKGLATGQGHFQPLDSHSWFTNRQYTSTVLLQYCRLIKNWIDSFVLFVLYFNLLVARTCNLILLVLDVLKPLHHKKLIEKELEGFGIRYVNLFCHLLQIYIFLEISRHNDMAR